MNQTKEIKGTKILQKPPKGKLPALCLVFLWIALWNIIFQALHDVMPHEGLRVVNWAFFISVAVFFLQEELTYKERFWHTLCGGAVGLLLAAGVSLCAKALMGLGLSHFVAVCVPLVVIIGVLILTRPFIPMFFNDVGFVYLICSFIESDKIIANLPSHLLSLILGSIILNLGASAIITVYKKQRAKKKMK
ncbi:MAG: hypothetical protein IJ262_04605 [Clostridia bacterium]|nr:hypothetical protein [Clostridia bacterium]